MTFELEMASALATIADGPPLAAYSPPLPENLQPSNEDVALLLPGLVLSAPELIDAGFRLAPIGFNGLPAMAIQVDNDGDGYEDEPIVVTGERENDFSEPPPPGGSDGGGGGETGGPYEPPPAEPLDCRDRNAIQATDTINGHPDDARREHGSIIYTGSDGGIHHSPRIHGTAGSISRTSITSWLTENGVSWSQVRGFVHNHDDFWYGGSTFNENVNRYPSGGPSDPGGGDWRTAEWMVAQGAGGSHGGNGFALYIIDTDGNLREFEYSSRSFYENLTNDERNAGLNLPDEMENDGSSC